MTKLAKIGFMHASIFVTLKRHKLHSYQAKNFSPISTMIVIPNFKVVGQTQAELHILKVEKLDACTRRFLQFWSHM